MLASAIRYLVVHCSATRATADIGAADITIWHKRLGWRTIGYHYVIRRDGTVEKGRPDSEPAAHVQGHNQHSLGICMVGGVAVDGKTGEDNFTPKQFAALDLLLTTLKLSHKTAEVLGHRDLSPDANGDGRVTRAEWIKVCPSFDVRSWWAPRAT